MTAPDATMSERILDAAVRMINEQGGIRGVNMRTVAKRAGCAHTNVYNHFESFDCLLWRSFERILEIWVNYTKERLGNGAPKKLFMEFISIQIDFAMANRGWYRCIWLELFPMTTPESVINRFRAMQAQFVSHIRSAAVDTVSNRRAEKIEEIIHGYLHGELCKLINMRSFSFDSEQQKKRIIENCRLLLDSLA